MTTPQQAKRELLETMPELRARIKIHRDGYWIASMGIFMSLSCILINLFPVTYFGILVGIGTGALNSKILMDNHRSFKRLTWLLELAEKTLEELERCTQEHNNG